MSLICDGILESMSRTFTKVDYDQALDLTVRLGDCLPSDWSRPALWWRVWPNLTSRRCMRTQDHAVGTPTPLKCCWACCSMVMPLGCSVHARLSVLPMRPCPFAPLQAICIPITIRLQRIAHTFLPELKDLSVQVLLLAKAGRCAEIGYDQPRWDQGACQCPPLAKR
jgi:hypothetical protein